MYCPESAHRIPTHRGSWLVGLLAGAAVVFVAFSPGVRVASAQPPKVLMGGPVISPPPPQAQAEGFVYVGTNEGGVQGKNALRAFRRNSLGRLNELEGSPIPTGGTGVHPSNILGPFDSDQCLIIDSDRDRLFGVNSGSDTIAVFDIRPNGLPVAVTGSPFPSGGVNPVSVGLTPQGVLFVANKDFDLGRTGFSATTHEGSYATFRVTPGGQLSVMPLSLIPAGPITVIGPPSPTPSQALVTPGGHLAFDSNFFGLMLRSFTIDANGHLAAADSQPIAPPNAGPPVPLGLQLHPTQPILYVGFVLAQEVGVFTFDSQGKLTFVRTIPDSGKGPCWLLVNAAGTRLYISNNFDNTVVVYDLSTPLNPVQIQSVTLPQGLANASPFQLTLDRNEHFLHVVTQQRRGKELPPTD